MSFTSAPSVRKLAADDSAAAATSDGDGNAG
jgi:hypothetical protein